LCMHSALSPDTKNHMDPFTYDYDTLRMVGLVLAIVMFVLGILIALSESPFPNISFLYFMPQFFASLTSATFLASQKEVPFAFSVGPPEESTLPDRIRQLHSSESQSCRFASHKEACT
uniref:FXYD domain-containing ion transport regulator n=1 Tax=Varanus komodoensis TaxID=61221 RepID=A0A8D2JJG0_VARKO